MSVNRAERERLERERAKAMARARRLEPNPGTGEDVMTGPGAYDRGTAYGLTIALNNLIPSPSEVYPEDGE